MLCEEAPGNIMINESRESGGLLYLTIDWRRVVNVFTLLFLNISIMVYKLVQFLSSGSRNATVRISLHL